MGSRSRSFNVKDGWRRVDGKPQRFVQLSLKNAVDAVDAVDRKVMIVNSVNGVNSVNSDSKEAFPDEEIIREPSGTPPLSVGEEWEEV